MFADGGAILDFVTIHPLFSLAPVAAIGLAWVVIRRRRRG